MRSTSPRTASTSTCPRAVRSGQHADPQRVAREGRALAGAARAAAPRSPRGRARAGAARSPSEPAARRRRRGPGRKTPRRRGRHRSGARDSSATDARVRWHAPMGALRGASGVAVTGAVTRARRDPLRCDPGSIRLGRGREGGPAYSLLRVVREAPSGRDGAIPVVAGRAGIDSGPVAFGAGRSDATPPAPRLRPRTIPTWIRWETLTKTQFDAIDRERAVVLRHLLAARGARAAPAARRRRARGRGPRASARCASCPSATASRTFLKLPFVYAASRPACRSRARSRSGPRRRSRCSRISAARSRRRASANVMVSNFHGSPRHFLAIETACDRGLARARHPHGVRCSR